MPVCLFDGHSLQLGKFSDKLLSSQGQEVCFGLHDPVRPVFRHDICIKLQPTVREIPGLLPDPLWPAPDLGDSHLQREQHF